MPEKVDTPVAGGNGYTMGGNHSQGIFSNMITSPFYPNFTVTETNGQETVKVRFTKGYVFDYSNSATLLDPIPIKCPEEFTVVGQNTATAVYVMLTMLKSTGELVKKECKIIAENGDGWVPAPDTNDYKRLPITSMVQTHRDGAQYNKGAVSQDVAHESEEDKFKWFIKLAEFENGDIKELYLRDNIHLNLLKIRQLGTASDPSSANEYPVIAGGEKTIEPVTNKKIVEKHNHFHGNGILPFIRIGKMADNDEDMQDNDQNLLLMRYDIEKGVLYLGISREEIKTEAVSPWVANNHANVPDAHHEPC